MKLDAALVAAILAATAHALPAPAVAVGEAAAAAAPERQAWGMPIIDHTPVPGTRRGVHIIDKIPVPEKRADGDVDEDAAAERRRGVHIIDKIPVPEKRADDADEDDEPKKSVIFNTFAAEDEGAAAKRVAPPSAEEVQQKKKEKALFHALDQDDEVATLKRRALHQPIVDHTPVPERRQPDEDGGGDIEAYFLARRGHKGTTYVIEDTTVSPRRSEDGNDDDGDDGDGDHVKNGVVLVDSTVTPRSNGGDKGATYVLEDATVSPRSGGNKGATYVLEDTTVVTPRGRDFPIVDHKPVPPEKRQPYEDGNDEHTTYV